MITAIITLEEENSCHNDPVHKILHILDTTTRVPQSLHCRLITKELGPLLAYDIALTTSPLNETSSSAYHRSPFSRRQVLRPFSTVLSMRQDRRSPFSRQVLRPTIVLHFQGDKFYGLSQLSSSRDKFFGLGLPTRSPFLKETSSAAFLNCPLNETSSSAYHRSPFPRRQVLRPFSTVLSMRQVLRPTIVLHFQGDKFCGLSQLSSQWDKFFGLPSFSIFKETSSTAFLNCPLNETSSSAYHRSPFSRRQVLRPFSTVLSMRQVLRPTIVLHFQGDKFYGLSQLSSQWDTFFGLASFSISKETSSTATFNSFLNRSETTIYKCPRLHNTETHKTTNWVLRF